MIMTDRYLKIMKAETEEETTATTVVTIFLNNCILLYGIPAMVLTDNSLQFASKLLNMICVKLENLR